MSLTIEIIILIIAVGIFGIFAGFLLRKKLSESKIDIAENLADKILKESQREAETIIKEAQIKAKDKFYQSKLEFEKDTKEKRLEAQNVEKRLIKKEENIEKKIGLLDNKELSLNRLEKNIVQHEKEIIDKEKNLDNLVEKQNKELQRVAGISSDEAKKILMSAMENEARQDAAKLIKKIEEETRATADRKSKDILATAVQRYAADYISENTVSAVTLPSNEMKGRIIGREGRNIRAIEAATGIDLIIDDTPEMVVLSGHNPIRREVARISLERLISNGRIHPARIEEIVKKVGQEIDETIIEAGEQATFDIGVHGINPELIKLVGKLKYRTSFAQNVLQHSLEVAYICGIMASELGLNPKQAKRAGLLHDIGKAVDHEIEGPHAVIGADLAKKYGESAKIINAIGSHHNDTDQQSVLAILVQAADVLSAARPGARREMLENYVKRIEDLERIASSFSGVSKCYAIQAGREVRIIVESDEISDEDSVMLARDISKKIEREISYPGQIKIVTIRETRSIEYAK